MAKILRLDMTHRTARIEPLPQPWQGLGGRALTARILLDEVDPLTHPLGPGNKLIFAPGLISGTLLSASNRVSVGAKSPLTGGIKEANSGGILGLRLAQAGYAAVIVEGHPDPAEQPFRPDGRLPSYWTVVIDGERVDFRPAADLTGRGNLEVAARLVDEFGHRAAIALLGPAGELRLTGAGVCITDKDGYPGRYAARGGVGAVMGAKGLKALVVTGDDRTPVPIADRAAWDAAAKEFHRLLATLPATSQRFPIYGTAATLEVVNEQGGLPTRNFRQGRFEQVDAISGLRMHDLIRERGGEGTTTHNCMPGCTVRCSNRFADAAGRLVVSPMEFETNTLMGSNLGIADFDQIARLNRLCNDLGLDTIETGAALGLAMEAGVAAFGDGDAACRLVEEIGRGTPLGRLLGGGAVATAQAFGIARVPVVKGQAMSAYDPRVIKGNGVTYATSPQGADHTAGNTIRMGDPLDPRDKVAISRKQQFEAAFFDVLGLCLFDAAAFRDSPHLVAQMVTARTGVPTTVDDLFALGRRCIAWEREFNRRAGLTPAHDRLPGWMLAEPVSPHGAVFDVDPAELAAIWDDVDVQ